MLYWLVNSILRIKDANGDEDRFIFIPDLKRLNAECNLIETVEGLEKLETAIDIILRDNEIVDINCVDWSKFTRLEILDLARNAISDIKALNNLPRIEILDLDYSPIKGPEGNIEYLIHLKIKNEPFEFNRENYNNKILEVVDASHNLSK